MTRTKQLMRENNAFERALSPEFNQVLTDMVVYLRSAPVSEYNQELVRRDIGRMFLDAQRRGDSPADVIGEDYRQFCDQVLAEVPRLTVRERVLDSLSASLVCLGAWGVIWLVNRGVRGMFFSDSAITGGWPDIPVTVGDLLVTVLILAARRISVPRLLPRRVFQRLRRTVFQGVSDFGGAAGGGLGV